MALETQHKEILFDTGIDDASDSAANEAGLDDVVNFEFHRDDSLTRRPGMTRIDAASTLAANTSGTLVGAPGGGPVALLREWDAVLGSNAIGDQSTATGSGAQGVIVQDAAHLHVNRGGYMTSGLSFRDVAIAATSSAPTFTGLAARNAENGTLSVTFFRNGEVYSRGEGVGVSTSEFRFVATPSRFVLLYRLSSDSKVYAYSWTTADPATTVVAAQVLDNNATQSGCLDACALGGGVYFTTIRNAATDTVRVLSWDGSSGAVTLDVGIAEASAISSVVIFGDAQVGNIHTAAYRVAGPDVRLCMRTTAALASVATATITPNTSFASSHGLTSFATGGVNYLVPVMQKAQATVADATSLEWGFMSFTASAYGAYTRVADVANVVPLSKPTMMAPFMSGTNKVAIALARAHDFVNTVTLTPSSTHRAVLLCGLPVTTVAPFHSTTQPEPLAVLLNDGGPIHAGFSEIVNTSVNTSEGLWYVGLPIVNGVGLRDLKVFTSPDAVFRFDAVALRVEGGLATDKPLKERVVGALPVAYAGNVAYVGGGALRFIDGNNIGEQVPTFPPDIKIEQVIGTGKTPAGSYSYAATLEWVDAAGNLHRSAPTPAVTLAVDGLSHHTVRVTVTMPGLTMLGGSEARGDTWRVNIYRAPLLSSTFYLRYTSTIASNPGTTVVLTEDDNANGYDAAGFVLTGFLTDTDMTTVVTSGAWYLPPVSLLYTTGGVLANIPPPAPAALWTHANRLWLVSGQDQRQVWFSKEFTSGVSAEFSDSLTLRIDGDGPLRAGASLDDKAILFTEGNVYAVATGGGGPTATNQGAYPTPEIVARGVGTHSAAGAVACPLGVLFLDASGFKLLGHDMQISDVGKALLDVTEAYGAVYSSLHVPERQQVWFVLHGRTDIVVFDYSRGKLRWSRFEHNLGAGSPAVRSLAYVPYNISTAPSPAMVADANTAASVPGVYVSRPSTSYDQATANGVNAVPRFVPASVTSQWLRPDGLLGDFRARVAHWMGHTTDGCQVALSVYRQQGFASDSLSASETHTWTSTVVAATGDPVHRRARLVHQRGRAFKLKLDLAQGAASASAFGLVLVGLGLEFGVRSAAAKTGSNVASTS